VQTETPCAQIDSDGDAITNDLDSDIDGDEIVNGLDDDIDGDKILNGADGDPAATNCGKNAPPPVILPEPENSSTSSDSSWIAIVGVALLGFAYLVLRRVRSSKK
jgi:LPXTG-motif cell wall-anchored protein